MKKFITHLLFAALFFAMPGIGWGQAASATWALTVDASVSLSGSVTASTMSKGSGTGASSYGTTNGVASNGWNSSALDVNDYYEYSISPASGYNLVINSTSFYYSLSGGSMNLAVYYSQNNFSTSTQLGSNVLGFSNTSSTTQFTNTTNITVNSGSTLKVRVYGWGADASTRTFRNKTFVFSGTTIIPGTTTITQGAGTEPSTISSLITSSAAAMQNFDFTIIDDGATPSTDALATQISQIVINQGTNNQISTWTQAIVGAQLSDGTNTMNGTINATNITFSSIANTLTTDLGYIADDGSKTYTLKIWLQNPLGGTLSTTGDNKQFEFLVTNNSATVVTGSSGFAASQSVASGTNTNKIDVTATKMAFVQQPTNTNINAVMSPSPTVSANDANGNRDLDFVSTVSLTSTGTFAGTSTNSATPTSGLATFNNIIHSVAGIGLTLNADATGLTSTTSNAFNIVQASNATDYFRSVTSGNWNAVATWESSADNTTWIPATLTPTSTSYRIRILSGHTVTITASGVSLDQATIESGGQLSINSGITFTLSDGTGTDLDIFGTFLNSGGAHTWTGKMKIESGGKYIHNTTSSSTNAYTATETPINPNSIWIYRGSSSLNTSNTFTNRTYGHLWLESTSGTWSIAPTINAGNSVSCNDFNIGANVTLNAAGLDATSKFNISGNLVSNGTIDNSAGYFNAEFSGNSKTISGSIAPQFDNMKFLPGSSYTLIVNINDKFIASLLTIDGTLDASTYQITGGGNITINGTLKTSNTNGLENTGTFAATGIKTLATGSTINYNGTSNQIFSALTDYKNVIIDGGSNKTLNGNATIANTLNFISGKIVLGANSLTQNGSITGASATSYVVTDGTGELMRTLATNTSVDFPIGSLANYEPANITFVTAPASGTISGRFITGAPGNVGLPITETDEITQASSGGYWEINSAGTTESYTGTFTANNFGDIIDYTKTHLLKRSSTVGSSWLFDGTHVATNGSNTSAVLQRTGMSGFSQFAVGGKPASSLPVTLLGLSGYRDGSRNQLRWGTGCESRNKGFEVQRSNDGINYTAIGFVNSLAPNGSSNSTLYYQFTDNTPQGEKQFYRLRQVDMDGNTKLSNVIMVNGDRATSMAITNLYPNPAKDFVNLVIGSSSVDNGMLIISDFAGKVVLKQNISLGTGTNAISFNISNLANGQYMVKLVCDANCTSYTKFVKQ